MFIEGFEFALETDVRLDRFSQNLMPGGAWTGRLTGKKPRHGRKYEDQKKTGGQIKLFYGIFFFKKFCFPVVGLQTNKIVIQAVLKLQSNNPIAAQRPLLRLKNHRLFV